LRTHVDGTRRALSDRMRRTFLSFLLGIVATTGCGGSAQSDESSTQVDTNFDKLTFA
jgi:hypothetical protein